MVEERRTAYLTLAGGLAALYALFAWLVAQGLIARAPELLGAAVTFDLTISAAVATWWLGSRRGALHRRAPFVVLALGFVAARLLLPAEAREGLWLLRLVWAGVELAVMVVIVARIGKIRGRFRAARTGGAASIDALEVALAPEIGSLTARLMASELSVLSYALGSWRAKTPTEDERTFSIHRRSQWATIAGVLIFLMTVETAVLHLVVAHWSHAAAWALTASSIWFALWLIGDVQALRLHPLRLAADGITVHVGVRWRVFLPTDAIASVEVAGDSPRGASTLKATVAGAPNVRITTTRPLEARGLFGRRRRFETLLLSVDRDEAFIAALRSITPP